MTGENCRDASETVKNSRLIFLKEFQAMVDNNITRYRIKAKIPCKIHS